jgi:hypothetical protein
VLDAHGTQITTRFTVGNPNQNPNPAS